jgi:hypothetical protein
MPRVGHCPVCECGRPIEPGWPNPILEVDDTEFRSICARMAARGRMREGLRAERNWGAASAAPSEPMGPLNTRLAMRTRRGRPLGAVQLELLLAIHQGRVVRPDATFDAPYWLDRTEVRLQVQFLRGRELVTMPLSGAPTVTADGEAVLRHEVVPLLVELRWRSS